MKRDENEGTLGEARMRKREIELGQDQIAHQDQVEIEGAWAVGSGACAIAAEVVLDGEEELEELMRRESGLKSENGVDEPRLLSEADRRSGVERGTSGDGAECFKARCCCGESGFGRAGLTGEIGAESNVGEGHNSRLTE